MKQTQVKFNVKPNEERIRIVAKQLLKEIMERKMEENKHEL
jgi:hypothetical protein